MTAVQSLASLLYAGAARDPGAVAVQDGDELLSYAELMRRIEVAGAALRERLPAAGSRVALCAANHADHLVAYLAILLSGHVWVPLNPTSGRPLNTLIAGKVRPDLVLVDPACVAYAPETDRLASIDELHGKTRCFEPAESLPGDIAAIKFTGGTSGEPKGVIQTHRTMLGVIENMQLFYGFDSDDCNLAIAPLTHGSSHYVIPVLAAGGRHRFVRDPSAAAILEAMRDNVTVAFMPPTLIYKLLRENGGDSGSFRRLRHLTYSAAPMPVVRIEAAQRVFGPCLSALYGQTEAPMTICALGTDEMQDPGLRQTVGRACANSEVRIVDEDGGEIARDAIGHVQARGPIVMQGYLDAPRLTAEAIRDGWLCTGDIGSIDARGYLTLAGRAGDVIITGGFNVYPAEIESAISRIAGIRECCVFAVEDDYWGERIEAAVVANAGVRDETIIEHVRRELGPVRTPKVLHRVDALPRNAVGKVVRREIRELTESEQ